MKKQKIKLPEAENHQLAKDLYQLTDNWVNKVFNFVQLQVLERMSNEEYNTLGEYVEPRDLDWDTFALDYSIKAPKHLDDDELFEWAEKNHKGEFEKYREDLELDNYPMWNTCFEFRSEIDGKMFSQNAKDAGFGIINGVECFNTVLFVRGAGYSFYAQHWIPLFLSMPWNEALREKYKDVTYNHM